MNTYSSFKSLESQILGRKIQEPNISVSNNKNLKSPRLQSPEQNLDQITSNKPQILTQTQKKKKVLQGSQGKSKSQMNTAKKAFYPQKQQKKLLQQQTKKKSNTVCVSNTVSPTKNPNHKKQIKGQNICEMIIKQQIKKQNLQKEQNQGSEKKNEQQPEKKNVRSKEEIQLYMNCKRAQDTINLKNQQIQFLLEQQRKMENLIKLDNERKLIFHKPKAVDQKVLSPKKGKKKSKKAKQKNKLKIAEVLKNGQSKKKDELLIGLRKNQSQKELVPKMDQFHQISERQANIPNDLPNSHRSEYNLPKEVEDFFYLYPPSKILQQIVYNLIEASEDLAILNLTEGDVLLLQYHYLQALSIKIQSVWKGYITRKIIYSQFSQGYSMQQSTNKNYQDDFQLREESSEENVQVINPPQSQNSLSEHERDQFKIDQLNIIKVLEKLKNQNQKTESYHPQNDESQQSDDLVVLDSKNLKEENNLEKNENLPDSQQGSMIQEIENQLQDWNFNIEALLRDNRKSYAIKSLKQQMQQAIVSIVQTQIQKIKNHYSQERKDSDQSINLVLRLSQETNNEKVFNDARKKFKTVQEQSEERLLQSSKDQFTDINRSSLLALQSQLMKREFELLNMREEAIQIRYSAEIRKNENDEAKKSELQVWLQKELDDLQQTRVAIEISTKKEASAMKKIQRDLIIAQSFDENNSKLQSLKKKVDEQLSNMKQSKQSQSDLKLLNNFCVQNENELEKLAETQSEDFEQENQIIQRQVFNENVIEPDEYIDRETKINIVSNEVFDEFIDELTEEILTQQQEFDIIISTMLRMSIPPSIPTSIVEIRYYIHNLFDFILPRHYLEILKNINTPYLFSPFKRLQLIHGYNIYDQQGIEQLAPYVLNEEFFLEFEQYRLQEIESQHDDGVTQAMKELEHIHNRAIFDACNETLNQFRPFYQNGGAPYPWEGGFVAKKVSDVELSEIFKEMELKIVQWAGALCGFLPIEENLPVPREKQVILEEKNQQLMIQQMQYQENPELFDPDFMNYYDPIMQIREARQYKMLIADSKDKEFKWTLDQDDRTELLMEISDIVFEHCIEDFLQQVILQ